MSSALASRTSRLWRLSRSHRSGVSQVCLIRQAHALWGTSLRPPRQPYDQKRTPKFRDTL